MKSSPPEPLPTDLAQPLTAASARLGRFGRQILWYEELPSTNDLAASLADGGAPEGCIVAANAQSAGRGRHGRSWSSPAGAGLYVSAVLRPPPEALSLVTIAAGVALADGIQAAAGLQADLKWPNDLYIGPRKVAGVLAEATSRYVVLGFGINVMPAAFPPEIAGRSTSLEGELGRAIDRGLLLAECLAALAAWYGSLREGQAPAIITAWRARAGKSLGRRVQWDAGDRMLEGVAEGVDGDGALLVRTSGGLLRVTSGEVAWL